MAIGYSGRYRRTNPNKGQSVVSDGTRGLNDSALLSYAQLEWSDFLSSLHKDGAGALFIFTS